MKNKKELKRIKYLHILWHNDLKFNLPFVEMINNEEEFFLSQEHLFITPFGKIYEKLKKYENVKLVSNGNLINRYGSCANWIFIHALNCGNVKLLFIRKKYLKKIIWRTWGHDVKTAGTTKSESRKLYIDNFFRNIYVELYKKIVKQFYAIGVANSIDVLKIQKEFGNMKTFNISYGYHPGQIEQIEKVYCQMEKRPYTRVLVGHSGNSIDNHIEILNRLKKYINEPIIITLILSYGDDKYIKIVKERAKDLYKNKVEIIEEFMPYYNYVKFISNIDIAILGSKNSNALGNLTLLSYFEKKIYVNPVGDLAYGINESGCKVHSINDIGKISFNDFIKTDTEEIKKMKKIYGNIRSSDEICASFKKVLDTLSKEI